MSTINIKMHQLLDFPTLLEFIRLESKLHSSESKTCLKFDYISALPDILKGIPINMEFYHLCNSEDLYVYYSYRGQEDTLNDWICDKLHWTPEFLKSLSHKDINCILTQLKGHDLATLLPLKQAEWVARNALDTKKRNPFDEPYIIPALLRRTDLPDEIRMQLALSDNCLHGVSADSMDVTLVMWRFTVAQRIHILQHKDLGSQTQTNKAQVLARKLEKKLKQEVEI